MFNIPIAFADSSHRLQRPVEAGVFSAKRINKLACMKKEKYTGNKRITGGMPQ